MASMMTLVVVNQKSGDGLCHSVGPRRIAGVFLRGVHRLLLENDLCDTFLKNRSHLSPEEASSPNFPCLRRQHQLR